MDQEQRSSADDTARTLVARGFWNWALDAFTPEALVQADCEERRRGRILMRAVLGQLCICFVSLAVVLSVMPAPRVRGTAAALLVALALLVPVPFALIRERRFLATHCLLASVFAVLLTGFVLVGDGQLAPLHWCVLLPVFAVLMGMPRSASTWMGLCLGTVAVSAWLGSGLPEPAATLRVLDATLWIGAGTLLAWVYEQRRQKRPRQESRRREGADRRESRPRAQPLAGRDPLTHLADRDVFKEQLAAAMQLADAEERQVCVLILNLDGFKSINDSHGHALGDILLQHIARRLSNCVRSVDHVSRGRGESVDGPPPRRGGDEFTILLANIRGHEEAAVVARRILGALRRPANLEGHEVSISASIGIAMYPSDVQDLDALLRDAHLAMRNAKERGKNNFQFFDESLNDAAQRRAAMAGDLRMALERRELQLVYQPIVDTGTREYVAVEALLRWPRTLGAELLPGEFIEVAEEFGLIADLGEFVLENACRQWRAWRDSGLPALRLSINVSGGQLKQRDFADRVAAVLTACDMPPKLLELEITENAMMEDEEEASRSLDAVKTLGVRVALDDFGTGYSSLSYVKRFPVDAIKIDRSFVGEVEDDPEARAITCAIIALAHELDLTVVAEGVESVAQARYLTSLRCDALQGYLFSRPLEPQDLEAFLREDAPVPSEA